MNKTKAVLLLSGGLDSAIAGAMLREKYDLYALTFDYGARNSIEVKAAKRIARQLNIQNHTLVCLDLGPIWAGSSLTSDGDLPQDRTVKEIRAELPSTYVPCRNHIFIMLAAAWAETLGTRVIAHGLGFSIYPDSRPEFIDAIQGSLNAGTQAAKDGNLWILEGPLLWREKRALIPIGIKLGLDLSLTVTCYQPTEKDEVVYACGVCDACVLRRKGFSMAGILDPANYLA